MVQELCSVLCMTGSLVPRPRLPKLMKGPGTHCVRMRRNSRNSRNHQIFPFVVAILYVTEVSGADLDATILYALQCIGCSYLTPKPEQLEVSHVYEGRDVFVWLPTGYCAIKFLPFVFDHKYSRTDSLVVVVSQLVSLMVDQVDGLRQKGVKAAIISPVGKYVT